MKGLGISLPMMAIMSFAIASIFAGDAVTDQLGTAVKDSFSDLKRINQVQHKFDSTYVQGASIAAYYSTNQVTYRLGKQGVKEEGWNDGDLNNFVQQVKSQTEPEISEHIQQNYQAATRNCRINKQLNPDIKLSKNPKTQSRVEGSITCQTEQGVSTVEKTVTVQTPVRQNRYIRLAEETRNYLRQLDSRYRSKVSQPYTSTVTQCSSQKPGDTAKENAVEDLRTDINTAHGQNTNPAFYNFPAWMQINERTITSRNIQNETVSSTKVGCCNTRTIPRPGDRPPKRVCEDDRLEVKAEATTNGVTSSLKLEDARKRIYVDQGRKHLKFNVNSYTQENFN